MQMPTLQEVTRTPIPLTRKHAFHRQATSSLMPIAQSSGPARCSLQLPYQLPKPSAWHYLHLCVMLSSSFNSPPNSTTTELRSLTLGPRKLSVESSRDNVGALELANNPKLRPRTKHIAVQHHHFRQCIEDKTISAQHIKTQDQLADIFTKPSPRATFVTLRQRLLGWQGL